MDQVFSFREVAIDDNPVPEFWTVIDYWTAQARGKFAPSWLDIDMLRLPAPLLPLCIVVDLAPDGGPISYRYFGSGVADLHGFELTRRTTDAIEPPELRNHIVSQYRIVERERRPVFFATEISVKDGHRLRHLMLRLPLSDDGDRVTGIMTFEDYASNREELRAYYTEITKDSDGYLSQSFD
jgi:hypothetical protein